MQVLIFFVYLSNGPFYKIKLKQNFSDIIC
ncbi:hypothetical protein J2782_003423 [Brucella pseudogrignonensis]|uniref:Uncharacterized protein n=1 Tax=Brucella pseudogrignonensis TaxID=419475 RepID=A0ABU1MCV4_9HYPH|nr:hypothetical protein [Brucella pseudogrignonensis]